MLPITSQRDPTHTPQVPRVGGHAPATEKVPEGPMKIARQFHWLERATQETTVSRRGHRNLRDLATRTWENQRTSFLLSPDLFVIYQSPRNPSERQRGILTLLAEGLTQRQAAAHLGVKLRCVTSALANMRERYTTTTNEALIALAIRLQWIEIAIDIHQDEASPDPRHRADL
jgi:DNA-binding CsgD family transcriptional regulator